MSELGWGDLGVVLAIGRAGSLVGASRLLDCSHTTVYRQINAIEDRAGVRFFERLPSGYVVTDAGEAALQTAERIEGEMMALSHEILGRDLKVQGTVVVTAPEGVVAEVLPSILAPFRREHPDVAIELLGGHESISLARREADLAIRATRKPPPDAIGTRIGDFRFAIYASPEYRDAHRDTPLDELDYCLLAGLHTWMVPHIFKTAAKAQARIVYSSNILPSAIAATEEGMGACLLPCYRGDPREGLVRMTPTLSALELELWVFTHPTLRHTARVRVLMRYLADALRARTSLFDGTYNER